MCLCRGVCVCLYPNQQTISGSLLFALKPCWLILWEANIAAIPTPIIVNCSLCMNSWLSTCPPDSVLVLFFVLFHFVISHFAFRNVICANFFPLLIILPWMLCRPFYLDTSLAILNCWEAGSVKSSTALKLIILPGAILMLSCQDWGCKWF